MIFKSIQRLNCYKQDTTGITFKKYLLFSKPLEDFCVRMIGETMEAKNLFTNNTSPPILINTCMCKLYDI